ncbi:phosphatase PAP2 family protein [Streptomyces goshikiensis]|uniref:phosphatase PAP2 family protein n=1 Tax=Streptomyces goshikiensis TaxID=1942 RepID=UPI00367A6094
MRRQGLGVRRFACWAVAVGLARVCLGVHWAADVLGGRPCALTWLVEWGVVHGDVERRSRRRSGGRRTAWHRLQCCRRKGGLA